ncbi:SDR family oxidoreductase [Furfurilactobacillus siliginis]|uniref:Short-chain alcohol dehydrogenase n=1 Tax=Furfurilactobacillus siliginis TaxID=348151 RepID=A0A0R2KYE0_9LACO|nr:SDR family oxidoreductase [Furfurilactobacillus siliginis]KRN94539.1 Short-chain alcohol dehydrogenase [Furfurilactobacillus siliginis]GEK28580.1 short-chain dehydrogenase/reductase [Furfurilactobacillus siliginis]
MTEKNVIIITGASSGFGQEAVKQYAAANYRVIATMRNLDKADQSFRDNEMIDLYQLDVTDANRVTEVVKQVHEKYGHIDVLFNNAGYDVSGAFEEVNPKNARNEFETNFWGPVNMIKAVLPFMRTQRRGHILNTSSVGAYVNLPLMAYYSASKSALLSLSTTLSKEVAHLGITVTDVEPGGFNTNFSQNAVYPQAQLDDYKPVYEESARIVANIIIEKGLGDLTKAIGLLVNTTLDAATPTHLVLGLQGYLDASEALNHLSESLTANLKATLSTEPDQAYANPLQFAYANAIPSEREQLKENLMDLVNDFQNGQELDSAKIAVVKQQIKPDYQAQFMTMLAAF